MTIKNRIISQAVQEANDQGKIVFLGNSSGVVEVPNNPGQVYVTDRNGNISVAWNVNVPNVPYHMARLKRVNKRMQVTELVDAYKDFLYPKIGPHRFLHEWGPSGTDLIRVYGDAWMPWKVEPTSNLEVRIYRNVYQTGSSWIAASQQDIDLTSHLPGSDSRYVLISVDAGGTIAVTDGTPVGSLQVTDIPQPPAGNKAIYAVKLAAGQSTLNYNYTVNDFVDLRHMHSGGGGGPSTGNYYIDQAGGTSPNYGTLLGARDGVNEEYTVSHGSYISGTVKVYLNGQLQTNGGLEDWSEGADFLGTIDMGIPPEADDIITVSYFGI